MTKKDYTAIVLVVDRSGSMARIAQATQSALEEFVGVQKQEPGAITVDTVFFDSTIEDRAHLVNPNEDELDLAIHPRGMTALYDAVGSKITSFGKVLAALDESERPEKVIFVIATDGLENVSTDYTQAKVAELIKVQKEEYQWDFTFIAANQDAILTGAGLNIPAESSITFDASEAGVSSVLRSMNAYVSKSRSGLAASYSEADRDEALKSEDKSTGKRSYPITRASTKHFKD